MSTSPSRPRIGVSSCLLGTPVRYDGAHKRDAYIVDELSREFDLVPVCPEVGIGLGVPRPPIQLRGDIAAPRARGVRDDKLDVTTALAEFGAASAARLQDISGYLFKSRSPSCGVNSVGVHGPLGETTGGTGVYAQAFISAQPLLPVAEESDLEQPSGRDNFIERVLAYADLREALRAPTAKNLGEFHARYKLIVMAHSNVGYRLLGARVASAGRRAIGPLWAQYAADFMSVLARHATRKTHANVLMHVMGYFKTRIDSGAKAELCKAIDAYRLGVLPWSVVGGLLANHLRAFPNSYLTQQVYLHPHPYAQKLRDSV